MRKALELFCASCLLIAGTATAQTIPDSSMPNAQTDSEAKSLLAVQPITNPSGTWDETATRDYYNSDIHLEWQHTLGDHDTAQIATATMKTVNGQSLVSIPVTGNDFYIRNNGRSVATFVSRQGSIGSQPTLVVNGTTHYIATRDVELSSSTARSLGMNPTMSDAGAMLIAFDTYQPQPGDRAMLQMTSVKSYGAHTLTVYRPLVRPSFPVTGDVTGGSVVRDIRASDIKTSSTVKVDGGIVTANWGGTNLTALAQVFKLPPAQEYFMTVVIRLGTDWSNYGGKLPGLANTGQATNTSGRPLLIDGTDCSNAGWGGRNANGCRWSARTGWGGRSGDNVGLSTYFYAQRPTSGWGYIQHFPVPAKVGKWFAYVERVRVNTPGQGDGRLTYWMCNQSGCNMQFDRSDITFRTYGGPQSLISEAWADVYCGGTTCGAGKSWPTSTVNLKRMTVTTGLPDLNALNVEVQAMNSQGN